MIVIVDGHNLIPNIPGLNLSDPDDESRLIKILQEYARIRRKTIEVYFDQAPEGRSGTEQKGQVKAVFVSRRITADQAIMERLRKMGKRARNAAVISSDRQVQQAARSMHASVITSEDFSREWQKIVKEQPELNPRSRLLSSEEVQMWEDLFRHGHPKSNKE